MDVTCNNFRITIPLLKSLLPKSQFVSIDLEFTGLGSSRPSQLDTPAQRYAVHRLEACEYPPVQFGLCLSIDDNLICFNYNLFPRAVFYPQGRNYPLIDRKFTLQSSTVNFLLKNHFIFEKCFAEGCSWLSEEQEQELREAVVKHLKDRRQKGDIWEKMDDAQRLSINRFKESVSKALQSDKTIVLVELPEGKAMTKLAFECIHRNFPLIHAKMFRAQGGLRIRLEKATDEAHLKQLSEREFECDVDDAVVQEVQFRYVWDLIRKAKRPLVVHNGFVDLVKVYGNWTGLPEELSAFKKNIVSDFGSIYDTKRMLEVLSAKDKEVRQWQGKRSLDEVCNGLEAICRKREKKATFGHFIPTSFVTDRALLSEAAVTTESGFVLEKYASRSDRERDRFGFTRYIASGDDDHLTFSHEAGYDALVTMRLFRLLTKLGSDTRNELFLTSCGGYKLLDMSKEDRNELFDEAAVVVFRSSARKMGSRHDTDMQVALKESEWDVGWVLSGGDKVFIAVLKMKEGKKRRAVDEAEMKVWAKYFGEGSRIVRYKEEVLVAEQDLKRRRMG